MLFCKWKNDQGLIFCPFAPKVEAHLRTETEAEWVPLCDQHFTALRDSDQMAEVDRIRAVGSVARIITKKEADRD